MWKKGDWVRGNDQCPPIFQGVLGQIRSYDAKYGMPIVYFVNERVRNCHHYEVRPVTDRELAIELAQAALGVSNEQAT